MFSSQRLRVTDIPSYRTFITPLLIVRSLSHMSVLAYLLVVCLPRIQRRQFVKYISKLLGERIPFMRVGKSVFNFQTTTNRMFRIRTKHVLLMVFEDSATRRFRFGFRLIFRGNCWQRHSHPLHSECLMADCNNNAEAMQRILPNQIGFMVEVIATMMSSREKYVDVSKVNRERFVTLSDQPEFCALQIYRSTFFDLSASKLMFSRCTPPTFWILAVLLSFDKWADKNVVLQEGLCTYHRPLEQLAPRFPL